MNLPILVMLFMLFKWSLYILICKCIWFFFVFIGYVFIFWYFIIQGFLYFSILVMFMSVLCSVMVSFLYVVMFISVLCSAMISILYFSILVMFFKCILICECTCLFSCLHHLCVYSLILCTSGFFLFSNFSNVYWFLVKIKVSDGLERK